MNRIALEFEPAPLAAWLWATVALWAAIELGRYVVSGRRPAGRAWRAVLAGACLTLAVGLVLTDHLRADGFGQLQACLALAVLMTVGLLRAYRQTTRTLRRSLLAALLALRLSAAGIVLAALAGPVVTQTNTTMEKPVLGIAVDDSRSMGIRDVLPAGARNAAQAVSRTAAVRAALDAALPALHEIKGQIEVQWFTFEAAVQPTVWPALSSRGESTALADAALHVHETLAQSHRRVAGLVLISDGQDNASQTVRPEEAAARLATAGTPLLAIGVGSELPVGETRSLLARRLIAPERVAVLNRLAVQAEFLAAGLNGEEIEVQLLLDGEVMDERHMRPRRDQELLQVDLACVPADSGLRLVTVRGQTTASPTQPIDLSQFVHVTADRTTVLYVDRPRYERAAIMRALAAARELDVVPIEAGQLTDLATTEALLMPAGQQPRCDVILVGDVEPAAFPAGSLTRIADLVASAGSGLAVLAGPRSFGREGFGNTPLAEILPVGLLPANEIAGPLRCQPTPAGLVHAICQLAPTGQDNAALWARLPELTGTLAAGKVRPAAEVLVASERGDPLLVVGQHGPGRTAVVVLDSTWRWSFADEQGAEVHRRFWRQLALWLANRRPEVWVATDRPRYDLGRSRTSGDQIVVRAGVVDLSPDEVTPPPVVTVTLAAPGGKPEAIAMVMRDNRLEAHLTPAAIGEYRLEAVARQGEELVGRAQTAFTVTSTNPELAEPLANLEQLKRMGDQTRPIGGLYAPLAELPDVLRQVGAASQPTVVTHTHRWHLVEEYPWPWLAAFTLVLTLEWLLRRWAGLV